MANKRIPKQVEHLILCIACTRGSLKEHPIRERFKMFMSGELKVKDIDTGKLLDPSKFKSAAPIFQPLARLD